MHAEIRRAIVRTSAATGALICALVTFSSATSGCADSSISLLPELGESSEPREPECEENADCSDRSPVCDLATRSCVECLGDADCGGSEPRRCLLQEGECVQCLNDADCSPDEPYCDPDSNRCEECLLDEHCLDGEVCDMEYERCVEPT